MHNGKHATTLKCSCALALLWLSSPSTSVAEATLKAALAFAKQGAYDQAQVALKRLERTKEQKRALLELARIAAIQGHLDEAISLARRAEGGALTAAARAVGGAALIDKGELGAAVALLSPTVDKERAPWRAAVALGLAYQLQGKAVAARAAFDRLYDAFDAKTLRKDSADDLVQVARACRYTSNYRDAADTLTDALKLDATNTEAYVELGELSLEKYQADYAMEHFKKALGQNPNDPRALVGLALAHLEATNDVHAAEQLLDRAEKVSPGQPQATATRVRILLDGERYQEAEQIVIAALKGFPNHLELTTMLGASYFMADRETDFRRVEAAILKLHPSYSTFHRTVAEIASRHHRYEEAVALGKAALKLDGSDAYALAELGTNYLRLGDDAQGLAYLRKAWEGDRYNKRTYNLLNLFEDVIAKEYLYIKSAHFRLRVHKDDAELIRRIILPELERAFEKYRTKYSFTPALPITVEMFRDQEHYAVRTVGLPGLNALGVCFGRVITTISPLAGEFNWGQVLWHELNHVFTIQMSLARIPRWFTEGMAELEPVLERPEWRREHDLEIYRAMEGGRLASLTQMKTAFSQARNMEEMVLAYYQGSLIVRFLVEHAGLQKTLEAVRAYGSGAHSETILPKLTGLSLADLEQRFVAAQRQRLLPYRTNWDVDLARYRDLAAYEAKAKQAPSDLAAQAAYALALFVAGKVKDAEATAKAVHDKDPRVRPALYLLGLLYANRGQLAQAKQSYQALIAQGGEGYDARLALGRIALKEGNLAVAVVELNRAKQLDPERGEPYALLAAAYRKTDKEAELVGELEKLTELDQQAKEPIAMLVALLQKRKAHALLRKYGQMAYYIQPTSVLVHRALAEAYEAAAPLPDLGRAIWHLETALMTKPKAPFELHLKLATLYLARHDRRSASAALQKALELNPKSTEARALKAKLGGK